MSEYVNDAPLSSVPQVFVDLETTGLFAHGEDRVCEIALVRREPSGSTYEWSQLVDPQRPISRGAFAVNRISAAMLKGQPRFSALIPEITEIVEGAVWIAHNAPFDLGFLRAEFRRARKTMVERPCIDTCHLARRHFRFSSNSLSAVAIEFGVVNTNAHRALGDCRTTMKVFESMVASVFPGRTPIVSELMVHPERMRMNGDARREMPASLARLLDQAADIEIEYVSGQGVKSLRRVTVIDMLRRHGDLYMVAHCHLRDEQRTFRIDRIIDWHGVDTEYASD